MAKRGRKSWKELIKDNGFDWHYGTIYGKYSKYKRGKVITDIKILLEQKIVIWGEITKSVEIIKSLPLRVVLNALNNKMFYFAVLKDKKEDEND